MNLFFSLLLHTVLCFPQKLNLYEEREVVVHAQKYDPYSFLLGRLMVSIKEMLASSDLVQREKLLLTGKHFSGMIA